MDSDDEPVCWICLAGDSGDASQGSLKRLCGCPKEVHRECLSRWQLQRAGTRDEKKCRFCAGDLPDWREAFPPLPRADPVMLLKYNGKTYGLRVQAGEEGASQFQDRIRRVLQLPADAQLNLTFGCKVPGTEQDITLEGAAAFDAAVTCAAMSAGLRLQREKSTRRGIFRTGRSV